MTARQPLKTFVMIQKCKDYFGCDRARLACDEGYPEFPGVVIAHTVGTLNDEIQPALEFQPSGYYHEGTWNTSTGRFTVN
jgi:hypothetical protein